MRKRTIKKQLWLNQEEKDLLKLKCEKSGLSESEFLRSCIKNQKIKEQPTKEVLNFQLQLTGIANNINQIARYANIYNQVSDSELNYVKNSLTDFINKFEEQVYSSK